MNWSIAILAVMLASAAWSAGPDDAARAEIAHLLRHLETSGCQFQRNGSWFQPARAATQSSASGKPYSVRCGNAAAVPSAIWLQEELGRFRCRSHAKPCVSPTD
jgi:hypothetical protein